MATDLQLSKVLSDFARTMVTDFPIQAILDGLVERIVEIMPVTAAGVTLIADDVSTPRYVAASNAAGLQFEKLQTELAEGPCLASYRTNAAVSVEDLATDTRFIQFAPRALEAGMAAVFAFPLRHGDHDPMGALDLYRDTPGPLDDDAMSAAQTLADVAAAYILNAQNRQELVDISDRFQEHSLHDALTGLANRVLFTQLVDHAVVRTRQSEQKIAVLFADLDRFKDINDLYGHQIGDELLVAVARRLETLVRPSDTLARLAGDEFVILCEDLDESADVEHLAARIDVGMNRPFTVSDLELHMTASIGIAYSGPGDDVPSQLLRDADAAMYQAKRRGGAGHQVLDLRDQEQTYHRKALSTELHGVLERGEIHAHYQPIVSARDGQVLGVEALLRWMHPDHGSVSPSIVIPLAEESRLICDIGRWMLTQACEDRHRWASVHPLGGPLQIAANISTAELLACEYAPMVASVLAETATDPSQVSLEITESVLIRDPDRALVVLDDLKELGVRLALDDFGTGYSSLSYLHDFPVDIVKIDRSFVDELGRDAASDAIVESIVNLAHTLNMSVVAEGVETLDQYRRVTTLGCDACQGFFFARPQPADAIGKLIDHHHAAGALRLPVAVPVD